MRAILPLPLLVLGTALADHPHHPAAADNLAMLADRFDTRAYLHDQLRERSRIFGDRTVNIEVG
jgi:hypothetical protein